MGKEGPSGAYGTKGEAGQFHCYYFDLSELFPKILF
jgi:hypothetical protein